MTCDELHQRLDAAAGVAKILPAVRPFTMDLWTMALAIDTILQGDCVARLQEIDDGVVDLAFADPPFNIGYDYDVYHDQKAAKDYLDWSERWMGEVVRVLKPSGTFWLAIGDEYAAELKLIAQNTLGLTCRSWVIWYFTFGVNCKQNFSRSHTHLFHFVRDARNYVFNDQEIRVPSARQLVYADGRANPEGRLPDNTWVLRPQDLNGFQPDEDTWYFPRVAGTFKERMGFHGCQMPEQLLGRIIRCCSHPGGLVLDPFVGSGTTLAVAKKLGRRWLGCELSPAYARQAEKRIDRAVVGQKLEGAPEPNVSAPSTAKRLTELYLRSGVERALLEALHLAGGGRTAAEVYADPALRDAFVAHCGRFGLPGDAASLRAAVEKIDVQRRQPASRSKRRPQPAANGASRTG